MLRIISYTLYAHPVIGDIEFNLCNKDENRVSNYYSIIIGSNGTGKSYLLSTLISTFNEISQLISNEKYKVKTKFSIKYELNGTTYYISTQEKNIVYEVGGRSTSKNQIVLPTKWLASSVTINDKFPIQTNNSINKIPDYKYLGIRSASNNAFIKTITKNSMRYFVDALRKTKLDKLKKLYRSLNLQPCVSIELSAGKMLKYNKSVNYSNEDKAIQSLFEPHRNFLSKYDSVKSYRADTFKKYLNNTDIISEVSKFVIFKLNLKYQFDKNASIIYDANFETNHGISSLLEEWDLVSVAIDLELLDLKKFTIIKDSGFSYEEASSGESHLLTSLHGILANLENNSLLIIDEPEISLHPNWQIDYIDILKTIVDDYSGVNTIIATHSHFLVSGIKNEESRILSLKRDNINTENSEYASELQNKKLIVEEFDYETYGWDPENILYNVFEVATLRNKYFELEVVKLIDLISTKSDKLDIIKQLKEKLEKYIIPNQDDPLKYVILQTVKYLKKHNAIS